MGQTNNFSQPFRALHKRITSISPHIETGDAEMYRDVKEQGIREGAPSMNLTAGVTMVQTDLLCSGP